MDVPNIIVAFCLAASLPIAAPSVGSGAMAWRIPSASGIRVATVSPNE